ncbi:MAG TPA: hypothetical protein VGJ84_15400 [Polyangiaceae bacterium]|jgi:hypothetical protein
MTKQVVLQWIVEALAQALGADARGAEFHLQRARGILERASTELRVMELAIAAVEAEVQKRTQPAKSR